MMDNDIGIGHVHTIQIVFPYLELRHHVCVWFPVIVIKYTHTV